eukprot:4087929-Alexandrium_andersonii.AAC.1
MSASLVGSEMCIRDSAREEQAETEQQACPWRTGANVVTTMAQQEHDQPVSYTHLTLPTICSV